MASEKWAEITPSGIPMIIEDLENLLCELERIYGNGN